ncbi:SurA N-terminal domain-containing protein [Pelomonas sp. V22]|uniref:SurA N-terminal domain-containing protein n=1 Tax=Pelomonas sp. V22 TaxID=2822139 RepID=UPI0024A9450C|nr:SurA N-terminal domain-containing protein [Pelomonas sp. V22]MDI4633487.1 SurA N-terminal domain-containing protein [Pelomonas sp. V22]
MFDFVRKHTKILQGLLTLMILPSFVFFGVQGYSSFMDGSNAGVAKVDGQKISRAEFDAAHRNQIERMRAQMPTQDPKEFDTPEARQATLDSLIRERVLRATQLKQHLTVTDEKLQAAFLADPQLAFLRNPNGSVNRAMLAAQGMSVESFMQRLREDLALRQVMGVGNSSPANQGNAAVAFDALLQQREVQIQQFDAKDFAANIKPTEAQLEAFHKDPSNAALFQLPESADIEYLVLDLDQLKKGLKASDEDLRKYYDDNQARYAVPEERRASHILIKADKGASAAERAKAKARAEELLAQAHKAPTAFAELARKNSQDEGSAQNGGDLDFFGRGAMVKPFEDAAFALKQQGDISNVVESDFGFHVIQLTGKRGGDKKSFEEVRAEIEGEVLKQLAQKRYTEVAETFRNTVYEQSDSLKPAADKLKLTVQTASVQRKAKPGSMGVLASQKLLDEVFGNDALRNKRNTEAVETQPNQMVSARVVNHHPTRLQPLEEVHAQANAMLVAKLALDQAIAAGKARLEALNKNPADLGGLGEASVVSRAKPGQLDRKVLIKLLGADASKLPAHIGIDAGNGAFVVVRINKLLPRDPAVLDPKRAAEQYALVWAAAEAAAYYNHLKTELKVKVTADAASAPGK